MDLLNRFETGLKNFIQRRGLATDEENYLFLLLFFTEVFGGLIHLFLIPFFLAADIFLFAIINVFSTLWYSFCCYMTYRRHYSVSGILATFEVIVYVTVSCFCFGIRNGVILFLIMVMLIQLIIPYTKKSISRFWIGVSLIISNFMIVALDIYHTPLFTMAKRPETVLMVICFEVTFVGTIVLLSIGNYVNHFILEYNKELQEEFKSEAIVDPLTGMGNRRAAAEQAQDFYQSDDSWMVAMLDIDNFKHVNDTYGHQAGDLVLKQVACLIQSSIRQSDAGYRWGGEEFLICIRNAGENEVFQILEKLRKSIEATVVITETAEIKVTVTMGVAFLSRKDPAHSLELSDQRLYRGKREGKNRVIMPEVNSHE